MRCLKNAGFTALTIFLMLFTGCGGGGSSNSNPPDNPPPDNPPAVSISMTPATQSLNTGQTGTFTVTRQNSNDFTLSVNPASGSGCVKSGNNAVTCTPTAAGTYTITVTATADTTRSANSTLTVTTVPSAVSISMTPATRSTVTLVPTPFTVTRQNTDDFTLSVSPASGSGCVKSGNNAVTCTPTAQDTYTITVRATADTTKSATATLTVTPSGAGKSKQGPSATTTAAENDLSNPNVGEMAFVGGRTFTMGCTQEQGSDCNDRETPAHEVTLSDFYIGKYEVTQAQWKAVMGADNNPSRFKGDDLPVENVSWDDVQEFIAKLNIETGMNYRLPTEAEWEYAARGGNLSKGYSGSDDVEKVAWHGDNSEGETRLTGTRKANELGIYDMSGNVYEWVSDWYGDYGDGLRWNPQGPDAGSDRVIRGGSWRDGAGYARVSDRDFIDPGNRSANVGFRLAHGAR